MHACLVVLDAVGRAPKKVFPLSGYGKCLFGRDPAAHCRISDDPTISRQHFMLEITPAHVCLKDQGSANGFLVNGVWYGGKRGRRRADGSVPSVSVRSGDRIVAGKTILEYRVAPGGRETWSAPRPPRENADSGFPDQAGRAARKMSAGSRGSPAKSRRGEARPSDGKAAVKGKRRRFGDTVGGAVGQAEVDKSKTTIFAPSIAPVLRAGSSRRSRTVPSGESASIQLPAGISPPTIPGYALVRLLRRDRNGSVYQGRRQDADGAADVAVRILRSEEMPESRSLLLLRRNLAPYRGFQDANIAALLEDGHVDGCPYLVSECLDGGSLEDYLLRQGPMPPSLALPLMRQMLSGLAAAHRAKLLHRDIAPANVQLDSGRAVAKLADFGLSKALLVAGIARPGDSAEGGHVQPPERLAGLGPATPRSDIFCLGATFHQMLSGRRPGHRPPERGQGFAAADQSFLPLSELCPDLPEGVVRLIDQSLAPEPKRRFPDADHMLAAFDRL